ncbi:MAG: bestrophin family ion channel [Bacteroidota bacterium]
MVNYNPKEWFSLIFKFHQSDTFQILWPAMLSIGIFAGLIAYAEIELLQLRFKSSTVLHSLLGFVISLMLVFRTNTAYERWSEGRRLWGSLVNSSRNLLIQLKAFLPQGSTMDIHHIALLVGNFAFVLKNHLRSSPNTQELEEDTSFKTQQIEGEAHWPNYITYRLYKKLNDFFQDGLLTDAQLLILNTELKQFIDICGACERIKKTPIPFSYSLFLKKFMFAYIMTMPFGFVFDFGYWIILIVVFVFYVLASLELIAEEIEQPFGTDANDLPLEDLSQTIRRNIKAIAAYPND